MASGVASHGSEAIIEDSQLFVARWQMDQFKNNVRNLRQDIERAQAKLQQLQHKVEHALNMQAMPEQKQVEPYQPEQANTLSAASLSLQQQTRQQQEQQQQ